VLTSRAVPRLQWRLRALLAAGVAFAGATLGPRVANAGPAQAVTRPSLLVLDSYGGKWETARQLTNALRRDVRADSGITPEFVEVPLRARSEDDGTLDPSLLNYVRQLFREAPPSAIVTLGRAAARIVAANRGELFPETPSLVLYCIAPDLAEIALGPRDGFVTYGYDLDWAIRAILAPFPRTRHLFVVLGHTAEERRLRAAFTPFFALAFPTLDVQWTTDLTFDELGDAIARQPPESLVVYTSFDRDATNHRVEDALAFPVVAERSNAPVAAVYEDKLGAGVFATAHARRDAYEAEAIRAVSAMLRGTDAAALRRSPPTAMGASYDARVLARWGADTAQLPAAATVMNRPESFWRSYGRFIVLGLVIIAVEGSIIVGLVRSRRRLRREQLASAALRRRVITAHEDEQRRLARELHDDVAQRLGRLAFDAARLTQEGADTASLARGMRETIGALGADVSAMSYRLHPATLEDLGLEEALRRECADLARRETLEVHFAGRAPREGLTRECELTIFRVFQEALRNAARHAQASLVQVTLATVDERLQLAVRDDGVGIAARDAGEDRPRLGFASMRERVALVGGAIDIESEPGGGTSVVAWVPLASRRAP
jgi:signal transduction histidine kinase